MNIWSKAFWKGAGERALKTFVQTFVAVATATAGAEAIGVSAGLLDLDWLNVLSVALLATLLSVATSLGNTDFVAGTPAAAAAVEAPVDVEETEDDEDVEDFEDIEEPEFTEVTYEPVVGDDEESYVDGGKQS